MITLRTPGDGPPWLPSFAASIVAAFKQIMGAPFRLWNVATADLPAAADFKQGVVYNSASNLLAYSDGVDWITIYGAGATAAAARSNLGLAAGGAGDIWVEKAGDTMTGQLLVSKSAADGDLDMIDTAAAGGAAGGRVRMRGVKPTAAGHRIGVIHFGALDSGGTIQNTAALQAFAGENWGTLAGEGTYLTVEVTVNAAFSRTEVGRFNGLGFGVYGGVPASVFSFTNGDGTVDTRGLFNSSGMFALAVSQDTGNGFFYFGATSSATPDGVFSNNAGTEIGRFLNAGGFTVQGWIQPLSYTVVGVPSAATAGAGAMIYVSNESGGAVIAFSDATNWRRVTDRAVIS